MPVKRGVCKVQSITGTSFSILAAQSCMLCFDYVRAHSLSWLLCGLIGNYLVSIVAAQRL